MNDSIFLMHVFSPTMLNVTALGVNRIWRQRPTDLHLFNVIRIFNSVSVPGQRRYSEVIATLAKLRE
jgi:hypothetical protein